MKLLVLFSLSLSFLHSCALFRSKTGDQPIPQDLEEAIDSSYRFEENEDWDEFQHPKETLTFFGLTPDMNVVEVSPGNGYFTEILAPYLAKRGQYSMAVPRLPPNPLPFMIENEKRLQDILLRHKEVREKTKFIPFEPIDKRNKTPKGFADLVVTFNTVHNWVARKNVTSSFKFINDILKPKGVLGIVQHRMKEGRKKIPKSGYLTEREVVNFARKAGFKLIEKSEINANPKDTADHPEGVWTLPPTYRLGEKDRDKYEEIGESDRMTLKFIKVR